MADPESLVPEVALHAVAGLLRERTEQCERLDAENRRLRRVLEKIRDGDVQGDIVHLRHWAYEALTLGRSAEEMSL